MKCGKGPILEHFLLLWEDGGRVGKGQMSLLTAAFTDLYRATRNVLFSDFLFKHGISKIILMWVHEVEYPSKPAESCIRRREGSTWNLTQSQSEDKVQFRTSWH